MTDDLTLLTDRVPPLRARQCRAFLCVRDEATRLPFLFSYYRALGVDWFCVADNGSTDGTVDFLLEQPDCTVMTASGSFAGANSGMDWINAMIQRFGIGHWCLFVDADELLVYPHSEAVLLPQFCEYLGRMGYEGMYAFLLDMYSGHAVAETVCEPGRSFIETCPFHDVDYAFVRRSRLPFRSTPFPPIEVVGGPRLRRFYPEFLGLAGRQRTIAMRAVNKFRHSRAGKAIGANNWLPAPNSPPLLSKVPLTFGSVDRAYLTNHKTTALRLAPVTGALLHFKFFADFHQRVAAAVAAGQHFDGGSEYARYATALRADPEICFVQPKSQRFRSSDELTQAGLLRTDAPYEAFCSAAGATTGAVRDRATAILAPAE